MKTLKKILLGAAALGALALSGCETMDEYDNPQRVSLSVSQRNINGKSGLDKKVFGPSDDVSFEAQSASTSAKGSEYGITLGVAKSPKNFFVESNSAYVMAKEDIESPYPPSDFNADSTKATLLFHVSSFYFGLEYEGRSSGITGNFEQEPDSAFVIDPHGNIVPATSDIYKDKTGKDMEIFALRAGWEPRWRIAESRFSLVPSIGGRIGTANVKTKTEETITNVAMESKTDNSSSGTARENIWGLDASLGIEANCGKWGRPRLGWAIEQNNYGGDGTLDMKNTETLQRFFLSWTMLF